MKRKILIFGLSSLFAAVLLLTSCMTAATSTTATTSTVTNASTTLTTSTAITSSTTATTPTTMTTSPVTTTAAATPVYGGTVTIVNDVGAQNPNSWDVQYSQAGNVTSVYCNPYLDWPFYGDIDTYGPRGNDQYSFLLPQYIPSQYLTGGIAQSWSFNANPLSITITLKQGIMWTGNPNIGMASRELTATDCAFAGQRYITSATHAPVFTWIKDCVYVDKYTYRWDLNTYNANWQFFLLYGGASAIPFSTESVAAGASNWKNAVGTGPFILTDFVDGSSATYTANTIYWGKTTINGKQYQLPFVNKLIYLIIPDQSTEFAALQTGKIDLCSQIPFTQANTLKQQAPNMIQQKWLSCTVDVLKTNRLASGNPLSNLQVRQALSEAIDFNSISNLVYGGGDILGWPVARGNPSYTALTNESTQVQALFSDNITQAQQMLASAGYPKGFTTTITIDSAIAQEANEAQVLVNEFAQVGVTLQIVAVNTVALASARNNDSFGGLLDFPVATANPLTPMSWYQGSTLGAIYKIGEPLDVEVNAALAEQDPIKEQADITQFCKDALLDVGVIPMTNPYNLNCYWPWLKNYYGEVDGGYHNQVLMIREMWIDQNLKSSLR